MKTLILTRHAKSDWSNLNQRDFDRALNERGLHDAPMMGKRLAKRDMTIDQIIASTAKRTEQTALLVAAEINYNPERIMWVDKLYHASASTIENVLLESDDCFNTILLVCHNNGVTDFANSLSGIVTHDMPTCSMMAFTMNIGSWAEFPISKKTLLFYDYPKKNDD